MTIQPTTQIVQSVSFKLGGFESFLPQQTPLDKNGNIIKTPTGDYFLVDESGQNEPYLSIGFNESYEETKRLRIPFSAISKEEMSSKNKNNGEKYPSYHIGGVLDNICAEPEVKKWILSNKTAFLMKEDEIPPEIIHPFSSIIGELRIPIANDNKPVVYSRQSKECIVYADELSVNSLLVKRFEFRNKDYVVLARVTIYIEKILSQEVSVTKEGFKPENPRNRKTTDSIYKNSSRLYKPFRKTIGDYIKKESAEVQRKAYLRSKRFTRFGRGMEHYDLYNEHSFWEDRPINAFLFVSFRKSSLEHWIKLFEYVMMVRKTEYGLDDETDSVKLFLTLNLREQLAVNTDIHCAISINTVYLSDYILNIKTGLLSPRDDFSNICEASGDCEDMHLTIYDCFKSFIHFGRENQGVFNNHKALDIIFNHSLKYECCLSLSALNCPSSKTPKMVFHMTALFLFKAWLLEHVDLSQIENQEIVDGVVRIKEVEMENGSYSSKIIGNPKEVGEEQYPMVLFAEGTGFIYPYQEEDYSPKQYLETKPRAKPIQFPGLHKRMYQSNNWKYHLRYIILVTNFFVDYQYAPRVNIPTLYFSYAPTKEEGESMERGVDSNDLYAENSIPTRKIVLVPQTSFSDVNKSMFALDLITKDKFKHTPHFSIKSTSEMKSLTPEEIWGLNISNEGTVWINPFEYTIPNKQTNYYSGFNTRVLSTISPNIAPIKFQRHYFQPFVPKSFKGLSYFQIPADVYHILYKNINPTRIKGIKYISFNPEHTIYFVWYQ